MKLFLLTQKEFMTEVLSPTSPMTSEDSPQETSSMPKLFKITVFLIDGIQTTFYVEGPNPEVVFEDCNFFLTSFATSVEEVKVTSFNQFLTTMQEIRKKL